MEEKILKIIIGGVGFSTLGGIPSSLCIDGEEDQAFAITLTELGISSSLACYSKADATSLVGNYIESLSEKQLVELSEKLMEKEKDFVMENTPQNEGIVVKVKTDNNKRI